MDLNKLVPKSDDPPGINPPGINNEKSQSDEDILKPNTVINLIQDPPGIPANDPPGIEVKPIQQNPPGIPIQQVNPNDPPGIPVKQTVSQNPPGLPEPKSPMKQPVPKPIVIPQPVVKSADPPGISIDPPGIPKQIVQQPKTPVKQVNQIKEPDTSKNPPGIPQPKPVQPQVNQPKTNPLPDFKPKQEKEESAVSESKSKKQKKEKQKEFVTLKLLYSKEKFEIASQLTQTSKMMYKTFFVDNAFENEVCIKLEQIKSALQQIVQQKLIKTFSAEEKEYLEQFGFKNQIEIIEKQKGTKCQWCQKKGIECAKEWIE